MLAARANDAEEVESFLAEMLNGELDAIDEAVYVISSAAAAKRRRRLAES